MLLKESFQSSSINSLDYYVALDQNPLEYPKGPYPSFISHLFCAFSYCLIHYVILGYILGLDHDQSNCQYSSITSTAKLYKFILVFGFINPGLLTLFSINIRVNGKVQPYRLGLFEFYILKFEKFNFTPQNLFPLTKSQSRLIWQLSDTLSC